MLGRLRSLGVTSKLLFRIPIQVEHCGALASSTATDFLAEGPSTSQEPTTASQEENHQKQDRHPEYRQQPRRLQKVSRAVGSPAERRAAPSQDAAQRLRQQSRGEQRGGYRSKRDKGNTGGSAAAVRGSQESGSSGRYLNTWPVVISNTPRTAVVADILHFLPPLGLGPQDIRPEYDADMRLVQFWVAMHTPRTRESAMAHNGHTLGTRKVSVRSGTPADMEAALNRRFASSSKGRYVMITGLTMKATTDDVMRLFVNFDMLPASVSMLMTGLGKKHRRTQLTMNPNGQQVAVVRFETYEEANRALRTCNFGFVRNDQIQLHIII